MPRARTAGSCVGLGPPADAAARGEVGASEDLLDAPTRSWRKHGGGRRRRARSRRMRRRAGCDEAWRRRPRWSGGGVLACGRGLLAGGLRGREEARRRAQRRPCLGEEKEAATRWESEVGGGQRRRGGAVGGDQGRVGLRLLAGGLLACWAGWPNGLVGLLGCCLLRFDHRARPGLLSLHGPCRARPRAWAAAQARPVTRAGPA